MDYVGWTNEYLGRKLDPLGDGISSIEMLPIAPSDLQVVNAARVSMAKLHTEYDTTKDTGLINYLAKHNHWTPFSHRQYLLERHMSTERFVIWITETSNEQFVRSVITMDKSVRFYERGSLYAFLKHGVITDSMRTNNKNTLNAFKIREEDKDNHLVEDWTHMLADPDNEWWNKKHLYQGLGWDTDKLQVAQFRIRMPIFVSRQWYKHQIGFTRNEVSRRYVKTSPEFFIPHKWRLQADNVKQGSSQEIHQHTDDMAGWIADATYGVQAKYNEMIDVENICPEQARSLLPQSMYTEFVETASIESYKRLIGLRTSETAQLEVKKYANNVKKLLTNGEV